jgi:8-amino-7-oxononanoate synthase
VNRTVERGDYLLDFASSLYLGLRHSSRLVPSWEQLTSGKPAALSLPPGAAEVSRRLAHLQVCESATVAPSTLHLFWDLFGTFGKRPLTIYVDAETYPIALWGVERARARGACVHRFAHHDADDLRRLLRERAQTDCFQIVVTDGFCTDCGRIAPLPEYMTAVRSFDGYLVVDDTQALGIFGERNGSKFPFGVGGGGLFLWHRLSDPNALAISSLAKAFGVPMAALVGNATMVRRFIEMSETNVHCSPPSAAVLNAARRALEINRRAGDVLRQRLFLAVSAFRRRLREAGLSCIGGLFPVQTLDVPDHLARGIHRRLQQDGVQSVLRRAHSGGGARVSFIITARHRQRDVDQATSMVLRAWNLERRRTKWS